MLHERFYDDRNEFQQIHTIIIKAKICLFVCLFLDNARLNHRMDLHENVQKHMHI